MSLPVQNAFDPLPGALASYGWNQSVHERYESVRELGHQLVRVCRVNRDSYVVATSSGVADCMPGAPDVIPVTGDWAIVRQLSSGGLRMHDCLPRTSALVRGNASGSGDQVLVANVDTALIVHGIDRPHRVGRIERLAILSWDSGVHPVIVLTKIDLAGTPEAAIDVRGAHVQIERIIHDIEIIPVSVVSGEGLDRLQPFLYQGQTVALLGESGAGKSSLVNRLAEQDVQSTGQTRSGDHKGRHTTTSRDLVPVPSGAAIVDTPGLRSVSMPNATGGLARSYADLDTWMAECHFRNCEHQTEPNCGIRAALANGRLAPERWQGYVKLQREMEVEAQRAEERARRVASKATPRRRRVEPKADEW